MSDVTVVAGVRQKALAELTAMQSVVDALEGLESDSVARILDWARQQYLGHAVGASTGHGSPQPVALKNDSQDTATCAGTYATAADMVAAASARSGPERALVVAYWLQVVQGNDDFDAQSVNSNLKHIGHRLANVTATLGSLINQRPQLVIQTHKAGKGAQARKRYKVTQEGIRRVQAMLRPPEGSDANGRSAIGM